MRGCSLACVLGVGTLSMSAVAATEVYKWVGTDGVTHYSETAPRLQPGELQTLELTDVAPPTVPAAGYQSALEVARDIQAGRLERERVRLERERLRLERAQADAREEPRYAETNRYIPVYPYAYRHRRHLRFPGHPGHGNKPIPGSYLRDHPRPRRGYGGGGASVPGMSKR